MSDFKSHNEKRTKKIITRRDFLKLGSGAAAFGVASTLGAKAAWADYRPSAPFFSRQQTMNLKMLTWFWQEPGRSDAWRAMIKKFHESQKDITIEEGGWPFDQYTNQILLEVKGGQIEGDLFTCTPDLVLRLLRAEQLEPLQDIVDKLGLTDTLSKAHDFFRNKDGQVTGLDIVTVKFGLLYNSKLFDDAKLSAPTTIDEWVEVSKKLTKRPDQFGLFSPHVSSEPESTWFTLQQWAVLFDGVWAQGKTPMVNSEPVIQGLKLFKTMFDEAMPQGTNDSTANKMYGSARIAQELIVSAAVNVWKTDGPDVYPHLRSAIPPWPSKKVITRIHPLCVNINAADDRKDASKVFVEWLYQTDNYRELLERSLDVVPSFPDGIRKEYLDSLTWSEGYQAGVPITPPDVMGEFIFYNQEFGQTLMDNFLPALTSGVPIEEAMGNAQAELEALGQRVFAS